MQHLLLYIGEGQTFDSEKITRDFESIHGTSDIIRRESTRLCYS